MSATKFLIFCVAEGMDSSATDSGTEDVLGSQMSAGSLQKKYQMRDQHQQWQYRSRKLDADDGDWLSKRSGNDLRTSRQRKVIFL